MWRQSWHANRWPAAPGCWARPEGASAAEIAASAGRPAPVRARQLAKTRQVARRLGWACELELPVQTEFSEPLMRINTEPAQLQHPEWDEQRFWDQFADYYSSELSS